MQMTTAGQDKLENRLLQKSVESFLLAIEVFNKPTIKNRTEGFSVFICNAWELMLKSYLVKRGGVDAIFYKQKQNRTFSLAQCAKKVMTNKNDPVFKNLMKMNELRNTSIHYITEEYEILYGPLFQACVTNFSEAIFRYHNVNTEEFLPKNSLFLSVQMSSLDADSIRLKYDTNTFAKILELNQSIISDATDSNEKYAAIVRHDIIQTKDPSKADFSFHIDKNAKQLGIIIQKEVDPLARCSLTQSKCVDFINDKIKRMNIDVDFRTSKAKVREESIKTSFTTHCFQLFVKANDIKDNPRYCYIEKVHTPHRSSYSMQLVDAIVDVIKQHPTDFMEAMEVMEQQKIQREEYLQED